MMKKCFFVFIFIVCKFSFANTFQDTSKIVLVYPNQIESEKNVKKEKYIKNEKLMIKKSSKSHFPSLVKKKGNYQNLFIKQGNYRHAALFQADVMYPTSGNVVRNFGWSAFGVNEFNNGILIKPNSDNIYAPSSGKASFIGDIKKYGQTLVIKSNQFFTILSGNFDLEISEGDNVKKGQFIGKINSEYQFEVRDFRGNPYDPIAAVNKKRRIIKNTNIFQAFEKLLLKHGFHPRYIPTMYCIANWESSLNPSATNYNTNRTVDIGLFQINSIWQKKCNTSLNQLYDIDNNTKCALVVLKKQGLTAWVTFKKYSSLCSG